MTPFDGCVQAIITVPSSVRCLDQACCWLFLCQGSVDTCITQRRCIPALAVHRARVCLSANLPAACCARSPCAAGGGLRSFGAARCGVRHANSRMNKGGCVRASCRTCIVEADAHVGFAASYWCRGVPCAHFVWPCAARTVLHQATIPACSWALYLVLNHSFPEVADSQGGRRVEALRRPVWNLWVG